MILVWFRSRVLFNSTLVSTVRLWFSGTNKRKTEKRQSSSFLRFLLLRFCFPVPFLGLGLAWVPVWQWSEYWRSSLQFPFSSPISRCFLLVLIGLHLHSHLQRSFSFLLHPLFLSISFFLRVVYHLHTGVGQVKTGYLMVLRSFVGWLWR